MLHPRSTQPETQEDQGKDIEAAVNARTRGRRARGQGAGRGEGEQTHHNSKQQQKKTGVSTASGPFSE